MFNCPNITIKTMVNSTQKMSKLLKKSLENVWTFNSKMCINNSKCSSEEPLQSNLIYKNLHVTHWPLKRKCNIKPHVATKTRFFSQLGHEINWWRPTFQTAWPSSPLLLEPSSAELQLNLAYAVSCIVRDFPCTTQECAYWCEDEKQRRQNPMRK